MTEEPGDGVQPSAESFAKPDLARRGSKRNLILPSALFLQKVAHLVNIFGYTSMPDPKINCGETITQQCYKSNRRFVIRSVMELNGKYTSQTISHLAENMKTNMR